MKGRRSYFLFEIVLLFTIFRLPFYFLPFPLRYFAPSSHLHIGYHAKLLSVSAYKAGRSWVRSFPLILHVISITISAHAWVTPLLSDIPPLYLFCHDRCVCICNACCHPAGLFPCNSSDTRLEFIFWYQLHSTIPAQFCYYLASFLSLLCRNRIYGRTVRSVVEWALFTRRSSAGHPGRRPPRRFSCRPSALRS